MRSDVPDVYDPSRQEGSFFVDDNTTTRDGITTTIDGTIVAVGGFPTLPPLDTEPDELEALADKLAEWRIFSEPEFPGYLHIPYGEYEDQRHIIVDTDDSYRVGQYTADEYLGNRDSDPPIVGRLTMSQAFDLIARIIGEDETCPACPDPCRTCPVNPCDDDTAQACTL
jgi:hypothetical protein